MICNDKKWNKFLLGDSNHFIIERGSSKYLKNMIPGDYPYISTTKENNGIAAYVSEYNRNGNLITLAYDGSIGACFYQKNRFFASEKIVTIDIKSGQLNENIAMFLIQILKLEAELYSYGGRKWTVEQQLKNTYIKLPVKDNNAEMPDWNYMGEYISKFNINENNIVNEIPDYFLTEGYNKACWYLDNVNKKTFENKYGGSLKLNKLNLKEKSWANFKIKDFFVPTQSKGDIKTSELIIGDIPLVSALKENNGIVAYIACGDGKAQLFPSGCLTADMFGHVFLQSTNFYSVSHGRVNILIPKIHLNIYQSMFVAQMLQYQFNVRNSYSRMLTKEMLEKGDIFLPTDENNSSVPDWEYMENYIKALPFSNNIT